MSIAIPTGTQKKVDDIKTEEKKSGVDASLFKIQTANKWMEEANLRPIPNMLFDEFWFESEICILFADTNMGKSILGVQIGDCISKGKPAHGFKLEASSQKVIYFDFELSDKQFEVRYSENYTNHYKFDPNFERAEINPDLDIPEGISFEELLIKSIQKEVEETGAKILIIDNLTYLKNETEKAKNALPLMKELKTLKKKYELSILILAHTPKRDLSKPITRNDLAGSKMLINFCDSAFAIGESTQDKSIRYLKQIKARNAEINYDSENAVLCRLEKVDSFLGFSFLDYTNESDHLRQITSEDKQKLDFDILELRDEDPFISLREIAKKLGTNAMRVKRVIDRNAEQS